MTAGGAIPPGGACEIPTTKFPEGRTGTLAGRKAHKVAGEPVCEPCAEAMRLAKRERKRARKAVERICEMGVRTGTTAGWRAHAFAREAPCADCAPHAPDRKPRASASLLKETMAAQPHEPAEDWLDRAACRHLGHARFFPEPDRPTAETLAMCRSCPARLDCATTGARELNGWWGGLSPRQRRQLAPLVPRPTRTTNEGAPRHVGYAIH